MNKFICLLFLLTAIKVSGQTNETGLLLDTLDGRTYKTITLGTQTWMAENLNYETRNSWCYDNVEDNCDIYGRLYTWEAALNACPAGWHLPSDEEYKVLEKYLNMNDSDINKIDSRGAENNVGGKLKSTSSLWQSPNTGATNESGMNFLPAGRHNYGDNTFSGLGKYTRIWTSTPGGKGEAWNRDIDSGNNTISRDPGFTALGRSVRCVKDDSK